jgi:hypothetical protein
MKTIHDLLLKDALAERVDEDDDVYLTVIINKVDDDRIDRLHRRTGKLDHEIIAMALKFYEDALDAL